VLNKIFCSDYWNNTVHDTLLSYSIFPIIRSAWNVEKLKDGIIYRDPKG